MAVQTRSQAAGNGKAKPKRATKTKKKIISVAQPKKSACAKVEKNLQGQRVTNLAFRSFKVWGITRIPNSEIQQLRIEFHCAYKAILEGVFAKAAKNPEGRPKFDRQYEKDMAAMKRRHRKALEAYRAQDHAAGGDYEIVDERPLTGPMLHGW
ncbi:hypothetical protein LTS10_010185 [Elasticomyces elasticus]|nr:hypothetical protein LTS10_010185 [Elasticomyces elasticus]